MSSPAAQRRQAHVTIARDHPAFAGHFPGAPVLPGVVLLSLVIEAVAADTTLGVDASGALHIEQVKFLAPAGPGHRLCIGWAERAGGVDFEISCGTTALARGRLSPLPATPAP